MAYIYRKTFIHCIIMIFVFNSLLIMKEKKKSCNAHRRKQHLLYVFHIRKIIYAFLCMFKQNTLSCLKNYILILSYKKYYNTYILRTYMNKKK